MTHEKDVVRQTEMERGETGGCSVVVSFQCHPVHMNLAGKRITFRFVSTRDMRSECQGNYKVSSCDRGFNCHVSLQMQSEFRTMTCFSSLDLICGLIVLYSIESITRQFCTRKNGWFDVDDVDGFQSSQLCILDSHEAKSIFPILHSLTGGIFL